MGGLSDGGVLEWKLGCCGRKGETGCCLVPDLGWTGDFGADVGCCCDWTWGISSVFASLVFLGSSFGTAEARGGWLFCEMMERWSWGGGGVTSWGVRLERETSGGLCAVFWGCGEVTDGRELGVGVGSWIGEEVDEGTFGGDCFFALWWLFKVLGCGGRWLLGE